MSGSRATSIVVSGFEPLDMLESIVMLLRQLKDGRVEVENQYKRVVPWKGNRAALKAMAEVFQLRPYFEWRGMGFISQSALRLRDSYAEFDAEQRFRIPGIRVTDPKAAQCGEVLKGDGSEFMANREFPPMNPPGRHLRLTKRGPENEIAWVGSLRLSDGPFGLGSIRSRSEAGKRTDNSSSAEA